MTLDNTNQGFLNKTPSEDIYRLAGDINALQKERVDRPSGSGGSISEVKERPKYFNILDAMVHFNRTVFIVQKLCDDIVGVKQLEVPKSDPNKKTEAEPSLLDVLERTPGNIHAGCNMIEETVKEIRAQIL